MTVLIDCVVVNSEEILEKSSALTWPVLKAEAIPSVHIILSRDENLIFTSKNSVSFFFRKIRVDDEALLKECRFFCVGSGTSKLLATHLGARCPDQQFTVHVAKNPGLLPVLCDLDMITQGEMSSECRIFTSKSGRTRGTVADFCAQNTLNLATFRIEDLYDTYPFSGPIPAEVEAVILHTLSNPQTSMLTLRCRSGLVVRECVRVLFCYLKNQSISHFPQNILFDAPEGSAQEELVKMGLLKKLF